VSHGTSPQPGRPRRLALAAGLAVGATYVALAALSGSITPLARRPLLDGLAPAPLYRWVKPPPALASVNKAPLSGRFVIDLDPQTGSAAAVYYTKDNQISLGFAEGAIGPQPGEDSVVLTLTPLDPARFAAAPAPMRISGNVYQVQVTTQPGNQTIKALAQPAQLVLFYPAPTHAFTTKHTILASPDGKGWTPLHTVDSIGQQLAQANVTSLGYFAVGESSTSGQARRSIPIGPILTYVAMGGLAAFVVFRLIASGRRRGRRNG